MPKKHPCPDCHQCQWCSNTRCSACLREAKPCRRKLSQAEQIALYESINGPQCRKKTEVRMKPRALFICSDNACLGPMAAALANHDFGDGLEAFSAGLESQERDPLAATVLAELGIDISRQIPAPLAHFEREPFAFVIVLGKEAAERSPLYFGGVQREVIDLAAPDRKAGSREQLLTDYRTLRDTLRRKLGDYFRQKLLQP